MRVKTILYLLSITILLTACGSLTSTPPKVLTAFPPTPTNKNASTSNGSFTPYPAPGNSTTVPNAKAYPASSTPGMSSTAIPTSGYEPEAGDAALTRDKVSLDLTGSPVEINIGEPYQVQVTLNGNLSDPCHQLRVVVTPPDSSNNINLEVYSLVKPNNNCTMVLQPFSAIIPLGSYTSGQYTILVNGDKLGEFIAGLGPQPGDDKLTRGNVTLDMTASKLFISDTQPRLVTAILQGYMPDPCHQLRIVLTPADSQNRVNLDVYSVFDPSEICNMIVQPFQVNYAFGSFSSGHFSVFVNGKLLGEFDG